MRSRRAVIVVILATSAAVGGCSEASPLPLAEVRGTVKYDDGTLVPADQIWLAFEPQGVGPTGKVAPGAAEAYVDVATGAFKELTTWKYGDGALVGRHKVVVVSMSTDDRGGGIPTTAIPKSYQEVETTPLEVEVLEGGDNDFALKIPKKH